MMRPEETCCKAVYPGSIPGVASRPLTSARGHGLTLFDRCCPSVRATRWYGPCVERNPARLAHASQRDIVSWGGELWNSPIKGGSRPLARS